MTDPRFQLSPDLDGIEISRAFNEVPRVSYFSTSDGPNTSGVTAAQGTIGIEVGSSATTIFWGATSDGTNNWVSLQ